MPFMPTLERTATLRVITSLCNECISSKQYSDSREPPWPPLNRAILEKIDKLKIPPSIKNQIAKFIQPIVNEVNVWWYRHIGGTKTPLKLPSEFLWSSQGLIDLRHTAENLLGREDIDITHRYFWACYYSLEQHIPTLWNKVDKSNGHDLFKRIASNVIVSYWTSTIDETLAWVPSDMTGLCDIIFGRCSSRQFTLTHLCHKFGHAAFCDLLFPEPDKSPAAAEYFWDMMTEDEKKRFSLPRDTELTHFVFTKFDAERQDRELSQTHECILDAFLIWPRHHSFLEVAGRARDFLTPPSFLRLLRTILKNAKTGLEGYSELIEEFWNLGSDQCKSYVFSRFNDALFLDFCAIRDRRTLSVILSSVINKEQICRTKGLLICKLIVRNNCSDLFKDFIAKYLSATDPAAQYRELFAEELGYTRGNVHFQFQRAKIILDGVSGEGKRKSQDDSTSDLPETVKRLRRL